MLMRLESIKCNIIFAVLMCFITIMVSSTIFANEITVEEQVLLDLPEAKITVTGIDANREFSFPSLKLEIENRTDKQLAFVDEYTSVNGFMIDAQLFEWIPAGESRAVSMDFPVFDLVPLGIDSIGEIETAFRGYASDSNNPDVLTDIVQIKTSAYGIKQDIDDSGEILIDHNGIKVIKKELSTNEISGILQYLLIYNETDNRLKITAKKREINGISLDKEIIVSQDIEPGKWARDFVSFSDSKTKGIKNVESMSALLSFYDIESEEQLFEEAVSFNGDTNGMISAPAVAEGLIFEDNVVKISVGDLEVSDIKDTTLEMNIKNISDGKISFYVNNVIINGTEIPAFASRSSFPEADAEIAPNASYSTAVRIHRDDLRKSDITNINNLALNITIFAPTNLSELVHKIKVEIPFDKNLEYKSSISPELAKKAADYIVNYYSLRGSDGRFYLVYELKNPNEGSVGLEGKIDFLDEDDNVIDKDSTDIMYIYPGKYNIMIFDTGKDPESISLHLEPSVFDKKTKANIEISNDESDDVWTYTVKNNEESDILVDLKVIAFNAGVLSGIYRGFDGIKYTESDSFVTRLQSGESLTKTIKNNSNKKYPYVTAVKTE